LIIDSTFGKEENLVHEVFKQKFAKDHPEFLKSYQLRKFVFSRLVDKTFALKQAAPSGDKGSEESKE
jgi:hypothetical protein